VTESPFVSIAAPTPMRGRVFDALRASPLRRDVKISRGTHLMHLEESRSTLYRETEAFLDGHDRAPAPAAHR
jgi:hypothetical protein